MNFGAKIKEAREIGQSCRVTQFGESWYGRYFMRHFSIYISYALAKLGVSANSVTVAMGLAGLFGSLCMIPHNLYCNLVGAALWQLWFILDCVDGEVARLRNESSVLGIYIDRVSHIVVNSTFVLSFGLHIYFLEPSLIHLIITMVIYSGWVWKREVSDLISDIVRDKMEKDVSVAEKQKWSKLQRIKYILLAFFDNDVSPILFIPIIIAGTYVFGLDVGKWCLYIYTASLQMYLVALILHNGKIFCKNP